MDTSLGVESVEELQQVKKKTRNMIRKCTYSPKENTLADWFEIGFLLLDGITELARAVDVMMARLKRVYTIYEIKERMFSEFLSSYRNTSGSLGELKKNASLSLKVPLVFK